jgi:flagellar hook-length control protein FliK
MSDLAIPVTTIPPAPAAPVLPGAGPSTGTGPDFDRVLERFTAAAPPATKAPGGVVTTTSAGEGLSAVAPGDDEEEAELGELSPATTAAAAEAAQGSLIVLPRLGAVVLTGVVEGGEPPPTSAHVPGPEPAGEELPADDEPGERPTAAIGAVPTPPAVAPSVVAGPLDAGDRANGRTPRTTDDDPAPEAVPPIGPDLAPIGAVPSSEPPPGAVPSSAGPSSAGPSSAVLGAGPSSAEPSSAGPSSAGPSEGPPSQGLPSQGLPSQGLPSQGPPGAVPPGATAVGETPADDAATAATSGADPNTARASELDPAASAAPLPDPDLPVARPAEPGVAPAPTLLHPPLPAPPAPTAGATHPPTTAPSAPPGLAEPWVQVHEALGSLRHLADGTEQIRVRLHPDELGEVLVEVTARNGELRIQLVTETAAARNRLGADLDRLADQLARSGFSTASLDVSTGGRDGRPATVERPDRFAPTEDRTVPLTVPAAGRTAVAPGGLDVVL